jgi:hypothetical protein
MVGLLNIILSKLILQYFVVGKCVNNGINFILCWSVPPETSRTEKQEPQLNKSKEKDTKVVASSSKSRPKSSVIDAKDVDVFKYIIGM